MKITTRGAVAVVAALAFAGAGAACGTQSAAGQPARTSPAATAPATPSLSAAEQAYVSDMRGQYNFNSSVDDQSIADFGNSVCTLRQGGSGQSAAESLATSSWSNTGTIDAASMVRLAETDLCAAQVPVERWHVIARFTGSSNWNSAPFTLHNGSPVKVVFSYWGNSMGYGGDNFIADMVSSTDDQPIANDIAVGGGKTTMLYPDLSMGGSPDYHLEVTATGGWSFKIMQKY
jgi:Protein of unknown function (DUF732)